MIVLFNPSAALLAAAGSPEHHFISLVPQLPSADGEEIYRAAAAAE